MTDRLYHFHVTQVRRSAGSSVIAAAAYRAGEKLYSERYGETRDYTRKAGVIFTEIVLPDNAPSDYKDRATLWNAVEKAESGKKAQLAYSFDIALQNELTMEENIALARRFVREQFVAKGMIADLAVHSPEKEGGIQNPHFHVLCPIRPLNPDGTWGKKQKRVYKLDENGERIFKDGKPVFDAVPTTDWGKRETLEMWRAAWADMVNAKLSEKGIDGHIDHRSYKRQGVEKVPTVHEGLAVRQMESKGIVTDKGELNRWIRSTNSLLGALRRKLAGLIEWVGTLKEKLSQPKPKTLADLLIAYYDKRNAGAWSNKARIANLKEMSRAVNYLTEHNIATLEELKEFAAALGNDVDALRDSMKAKANRIKELKDLLRYAESYRQLKPLFDEMNAIKWKSKKAKFKEAHEQELRLFYVAQRKLKAASDAEGRYSESAWKQEIAKLERERQTEYERFKALRENLMELLKVKHCVDVAAYQQEAEQRRQQEENQAYYQRLQNQQQAETR